MSGPRAVRLSNIPRGAWLRATNYVAPSLAALICLAGVTAPSTFSLGQARNALEFARARSAECSLELGRHERNRSLDAANRAQRVLEVVRARTPETLDPLVLQGALRIAAELSGFQLESLTLGVERDPGLPTTRDRLVLQLVELVGRGRLSAPVRLVEQLDALGYPSCVLEANVDLSASDNASAALRLQLGVFHFAPLLGHPGETAGEFAQESP